MEKLITTKNLGLGYDKDLVLENVNLQINKGDFVLLLGENGSGKTTLVRSLLGLLPIKTGSIEKTKELEISYISQQKYTADFPASVFEVVLSGRLKDKKGSFYKKEDRQIALESLEKLGIKDLKNQAFRKLSGGQKQRVLMARALVSSFDLLVLDEPTSGLDIKTKEDLYRLLQDLNQEGKTIVLISHEDKSDYVENMKTLLFKNGKVVEVEKC